MKYNDKLDADEQISMEEAIAARIYQNGERSNHDDDCIDVQPDLLIHEEDCADLGRNILQMVLAKFRPDLFTCSWCDKSAKSVGRDGTFSCNQGQGDGLEPHGNKGVTYSPVGEMRIF